MKISLRYVVILLIISLLFAVYLYFGSQSKEKILGNTLVLGFVEKDSTVDVIENQWSTLGLFPSFINDCVTAECFLKNIENAISRVKHNNKQLVVLAEKKLSSAVLKALNKNYSTHIQAVVFLQPQITDFANQKWGLPKTLIISEASDSVKTVSAERRLASMLRKEEQWIWFTMLAGSGKALMAHPILPHMISYLLNQEIKSPYQTEFLAESHWQHPLVNNQAFLNLKEFIETRKVDNDIQRILSAFYAYDPNLLKQWPRETYKAFNILKYRNQLPAEKQGRYMSFANRNGHKFYLDLKRYGRYGPEFVVAIDDEDNLYRLTSFYKTNRYYSWKDGGPSENTMYAQSLGAFIHFQNPLPSRYELPYLQYSSILFESIEFTNQDPFAKLTNLSYPASRTLTMNCIPCHSVDGIGGAAHHLNYINNTPEPGFAKPLRSYSNEVLQNFFFNQTATAKLIGVNPNYVEQRVGEELLAWLQDNK